MFSAYKIDSPPNYNFTVNLEIEDSGASINFSNTASNIMAPERFEQTMVNRLPDVITMKSMYVATLTLAVLSL